MRIGIGYDVHKLTDNRKLIIGGVEIPHSKGLDGHSDADVLVHAIMDSILGGLALGDIGKHFPDTDSEFKDICSMDLLERVHRSMKAKGYKIGNIDCVIAAQKPKLAPFIEDMRKAIGKVLDTELDNINVKATTTEKLGFEGREEGISAQAVCIMKKD